MTTLPGFDAWLTTDAEGEAAEAAWLAFEERMSTPEMVEFAAIYLTELACESTGLELPEDIAWHRAEQHRASQKIAQHMLNHDLDQFARLVAAAESYYRLIAEMDRERAAKRGAA